MTQYTDLISLLSEMNGVVVGYSGGVDSTLLAKAATDALGDKALCVLVDSCFIPRTEIAEAVSQAESFGFNLLRVEADALAIEHVPDNNPQRCYYCKMAVFSHMNEIARSRGLSYVLDGSNADDASDYRPGTRATAELSVRSPLKELGFTKADIRSMSKELGLPTWDKPSYACLASRVPYGTRLTAEILARVEAAEAVMRELGFGQLRIRHHGDVARIEVPSCDIEKLATEPIRDRIVKELRALGYAYVALDLAGYRTGSMNEVLRNDG